MEKPVAIINLNGDIYRINKEFSKFFPISSQGNIKQLIDQQSIGKFEDALGKMTAHENIICHLQMKLKCGDNCIMKTKLYFPEKENLVVLSFLKSNNYYKKREKIWLNALAYVDQLLFLSDNSGCIQDMNDLSLDYFNLPKEHFIGHHIEDVLSLLSWTALDIDAFKREALEHEYAESIQLFHHPIKNNRYYKVTLIKDFKSDLYVLKISDYTKKRALQQHVEQKDSLLEVGQLAASVAHEIRNPITTLKGFTQLLKITAAENTMKYLNVIEDEIERMESILTEMLTLSKPKKIKKQPLSLNGVLDDISQVIAPKATLENIQLIRRDELKKSPFVLGDEGRLKQVFLNLLKNSLESMQPGGTLTIYTQPCGQDQVNIIIEDTGKGIAAHNLPQVFMPYFTTKSDGTGLGMPFVLQTIEEHDGTISVSSEVGIGTSFILTMPIVKRVERRLKKL